MKNKIKAILLDFDGTILDTEKFYMNFWIDSLKQFGYKMTKNQYLQIRSLGKSYLREKVKDWYGEELDQDALQVCRFKMRDEFFSKHDPDVKKGIKEALVWLKKHDVVIAVVTSGDQKKVFSQLKKAKLFKYFDKFVFQEHVKKGKPAPDIYIHACKQLGFKPKECIAIEDSDNGAISAYKAKVNTIMIPDMAKPSKEITNLNIKVIKDGFELIKYLETIIK